MNFLKNMISEEQLKKFKCIYKKRFDKDLLDEEALEKANKLLNLVKIIYRPMTEEEYNKVQKRREQTKQ